MSVSKKIGPSSASWGSFIFVGITLCWASQVALVVKNPPANEGDVRDTGLIPGLKRSLGRGHHNLLQYCLKNPMDRRSLVDYSPWGCRVRHDWHDLECTHSCLKMGKKSCHYLWKIGEISVKGTEVFWTWKDYIQPKEKVKSLLLRLWFDRISSVRNKALLN